MPKDKQCSCKDTPHKKNCDIWKNVIHSLEREEYHCDCPTISKCCDELSEYKQFVLNVLDGIDEADRQMGNKGGGTLAIRFALQSRVINEK